MKYVVFYSKKDMSVTLFANGGSREDAESFKSQVESFVKSFNKDYENGLTVSFRSFENVNVCRIKTGITFINDFVRLVNTLGSIYNVYED